MIIYKKENKYYDRKDNEIKDSKTLDYIKKLVIPPAYRNVEIYYVKNPKILYMGIDDKGRKQFIYSQKHKEKARKEKLMLLIHFGQQLPIILDRINSILQRPSWTREKMIVFILKIISQCYFRIGNIKYQKLYNSHGISTIEEKHVKVVGSNTTIKFIGKKGVKNTCTISDSKIASLMKSLIRYSSSYDDKHLFVHDNSHIKHTEVNDWLKQFNSGFTSKLFRTYDANVMIINKLNPDIKENKYRKKEVVKTLKEVSDVVHNTPAICKKDYIDTDILIMYLQHPIKYRKLFKSNLPTTQKFIKYLKSKYKV